MRVLFVCQLSYFVLLYSLAVRRTVPNFVGPSATRRECHTLLKRRVRRSERTQIINSLQKSVIPTSLLTHTPPKEWEKFPRDIFVPGHADVHLCPLSCSRSGPGITLGCDFFKEETDTQIHKRTGGNNFFKMASFAYLWITPGFCCHAGRRCADTHFRAMPTSHLFEVALAVDSSKLSSRKLSKLSRCYARLKKKINTMADPTPNAWVC
jgi:hypothetical protein